MTSLTQPEFEPFEILFEEGIIGVPRARRFQLLESVGSEVRELRCLDVPGFSLTVIDPQVADPGYEPRFGPRIRNSLELHSSDPVLVLAVATLEDDGAVANLRAPLLININLRIGSQVILDARSYSTRVDLRLDD